MTVYVDDANIPFGRMLMSHMWADDLNELLAMADRIGVARRWLQQPPKASWVHFDIAKSKKLLALEFGAVLTDRYGPVEGSARQLIERGRREGDDRLIAIGEGRLAMVASVRDQRDAP